MKYRNIFTNAIVEYLETVEKTDRHGFKYYYIKYRKQRATPPEKSAKGYTTLEGKLIFEKSKETFEKCYVPILPEL